MNRPYRCGMVCIGHASFARSYPLCYHLPMIGTATAGRRIQVQVFPAFRKMLSAPWLRRVAQEALRQGAALVPGTTERATPLPSLSLAIADDDTVRRLNRDYRGLDEVTDVLAFAFGHPGHYEGDGPPPANASREPFVTAPDEAGFIGEVVVCYPQCLRQAAEQGHDPLDELALLITHGVLHLMGYDHATADDEAAMIAVERESLATLGIAGARP